MPKSGRISRLLLTRREEIGVALLLLLLAGLSFVFQYGTLEKFASIPPGTGLATLQEWVHLVRGRIGLSWHDALIPISMVAVILSILSLEIRGRTAAACTARTSCPRRQALPHKSHHVSDLFLVYNHL